MQQHITIMKAEGVEALALRPDSIVIDATLGSGGHTQAILDILGSEGILIALDADQTAIATNKTKLRAKATTHLVCRNFREIDEVCKELGIEQVDAILADLGWRMEQFDHGGKGLSFQVDEPLTMTFGDPTGYPFTAREIVNEWDEEVLRNILKGYGEEKFAGRIARHIVEARATKPIETSFELVQVIENAVPSFYKNGKIHPATRTFQALRIAVNDELEALSEFLRKAVTLLREEGRLAVITFHSLEDRIVKHTFRDLAHDSYGEVITKKPIIPTDEEIVENPRARSAKLRIFKKQHDQTKDISSTL